ncbi:uncharacterized protein LOC119555421 [Drosophila subpulchrella]|uniref:uncharacterized protein LOC119555421 n=1 Tax=Drosophila subpulchrella TaxID=1486046 RepID=UPI0018A14E78|nr:uncharacterized protein LOC119555421 [Drosophila subpulchrella]
MSRMNHNKPKWDESHSARKGNKLKPNTWESGGIGNLTTKYNYLALCLVGVIGTAFDFFIRNKKAKKQILKFCSLLVAIGNLLMVCFQATGGRNRKYMRRSNKHK